MKKLLIVATLAGMASIAPAAPPQSTNAKPLPVSIDGLPIGAIPQQELPPSGCAAFLWSKTQTQALVAMMTSDPAQIRFAPGGTVTDLVRVGQSGQGERGFVSATDYAGGDYRVRIEMEIVTRGDLTDGAAIPAATMRVDHDGHDSVVVPVAGLIGCG